MPATPSRPTRRRRRRAYPARVETTADTGIVARSAQVAATPERVPLAHRPDPQLRRGQLPLPAAAPVDHLQVPATHRPFAHPSEEEFARILDFYRIEWKYEPRSFPLVWEGNTAVEMFTPDFYLPDLDMYIELTTMKQSLVTAKNRKLRLLKELYPEISIKLLYKKDYHRLLAKYDLIAVKPGERAFIYDWKTDHKRPRDE